MSAKLRKVLSLALTISLLFQQTGFAQLATELNIASHLSRMANSIAVEKFRPLHLRYFSYDPRNDNFKVLADKGDQSNRLTGKLEEEAQALFNYFLVGLALPNSAFWVNLRPDSESQIIDEYLSKTDVGRIMLEADLQLKKDTSSMTSPQTPEGREYWDRLYKKAEELYGYDNVTIPTLTRPWIVPGEIIIRETQGEPVNRLTGTPPSAYIYKATLKIMLESDYLKTQGSDAQGRVGLKDPYSVDNYQFKDSRAQALNEYSTQLIKELIIPKLTREVNSSRRYAPLRQVYYSLILSRWFKQRFGPRAQSQEYRGKNAAFQAPGSKLQANSYISLIDTKDLTNLISKDPWSKTEYFKQYQKSFANGEYNIQEPVYTPTGQMIRSYFSGGITTEAMNISGAGSPIQNRIPLNDKLVSLSIGLGRNLSASPISRISSPISPLKENIEEGISKRKAGVWAELIPQGSKKNEITRILNQATGLEISAASHLHPDNDVSARTTPNTGNINGRREGPERDASSPIATGKKTTLAGKIISQITAILEFRDQRDPKSQAADLVRMLAGISGLQELANRLVGDAEGDSLSEDITDKYNKYKETLIKIRTALLGEKLATTLERLRKELPYDELGNILKRTSDALKPDQLQTGSNEPRINKSASPLRPDKDASATIPSAGNINVSREGPDSVASSAMAPGGIDFTKLPLTIQPMGSFKGLHFQLPQLTQAQLAQINIEAEVEQLQQMASSGIMPSGQRIKELISACVQKGQINAQIDRLLSCLANALSLDEENAVESSAELKEALAIATSI